MAWFSESSASFDQPPSPSNRPDRAPASWIAAVMLSHLQAVSCNAHTYAETLLTAPHLRNPEVRHVASCLYPSLSLVNHSCDPSVTRICVAGGGCFLVALRPLPAGTEVLDCYSTHYALQPRSSRHTDLSQYCFSCACQACRENWPDLSATPSAVSVKCCGDVVTQSACTRCGSLENWKTYRRLVEKELPTRLEVAMTSWGTEQWVEGLEWTRALLTRMQTTLGVSRPAQAWDIAQEIFKTLLTMLCGNWCLEPQ